MYMAFVIILYVRLHKEMGQKSTYVLGTLILGINARFVVVKNFSMDIVFLDSSIAANRSHPTMSQQLWKNKAVKPFGPEALSRGNEK